jgi:hypothetical protein
MFLKNSLTQLNGDTEMPNWTHNHLEIYGEEESLKHFKDLTTFETVDEEGEVEVTHGIISTLLPTPQELLETVKGYFPDEERRKKMEEQNERNLQKYGYKDWYDWNYANWGCKWSDCDTVMEEVDGSLYYKFDTPWLPPIPAMQNISKLFPSLTFILSFTEEANHFIGAALFANGAFIEVEGDTTVGDAYYRADDYASYIEALDNERQQCVLELLERIRDFNASCN